MYYDGFLSTEKEQKSRPMFAIQPLIAVLLLLVSNILRLRLELVKHRFQLQTINGIQFHKATMENKIRSLWCSA